jgi:predicted DCC family thiol-disulfide oxidoreductase YuxK
MIKVYFDGLCVVCSAEISHYKKMKGSENIDFIDITSNQFNSKKENLDPFLVHKELHAKDENGQLHIGVDAFSLIWSKLNKLTWLSRLSRKQPLNSILKMNYVLFTKIRPYLPRKSCETSPYCESKTN